MRLLEVGNGRGGGDDEATGQRVSRILSFPPPRTGTNYNLIDKVEHAPADRVIWHIIYSPDGRFTYDFGLGRSYYYQGEQLGYWRLVRIRQRGKLRGVTLVPYDAVADFIRNQGRAAA